MVMTCDMILARPQQLVMAPITLPVMPLLAWLSGQGAIENWKQTHAHTKSVSTAENWTHFVDLQKPENNQRLTPGPWVSRMGVGVGLESPGKEYVSISKFRTPIFCYNETQCPATFSSKMERNIFFIIYYVLLLF